VREQAEKNKKAWEYRAYEYWNDQGSPADKAIYLKNDPLARLRYHQKYFQNIKGIKIANPCGSNGRIAVPLALLGAEVTIFDISEENKRYALELAECAGVNIQYVVDDFYDVDMNIYSNCFDVVYSEGGILHYFSEIDKFTENLFKITKYNGKLILSDFHPFRKTDPESNAYQTGGDYFDSKIHKGDVAYKSFFPKEDADGFPDCSLRFYTLSEIINSVIKAGFVIKEFNEHPNWNNSKLPGEFTIIADKIQQLFRENMDY
jgi:2-polyprenyl-3-methyl-5-hydroxy-6-metoxy-1,4-benzoquinol methylase